MAQGTTYALIVGVAKYQHPSIKHLKYADDDAIAFKRMLMSPAGGHVKPENIKCFINDSATTINIGSSFSWIVNSPKSGDRVIFYFSGHGDAVDPELVYLLTYDANGSDPNLYEYTAIDMHKIKNMIKKLRIKGVEVVLITDACRSNELSDMSTSTMYAFKSIMNSETDEIRFTSASANQNSTEDLRWGNGHGVFTYYLLQGWMGMANENDDNEITAGELFRYVTKKVKDATYDNSAKKTMQTPSTCCSDHEDIVLATIDAETLKRLKEIEDQVVVTDDVFAYVTTKSGSDNYDEDTATMRIYNLLVGAIADKKILQPKNESALYYYNQLKKVAKGKPIFYDGESELLAALNVSGQRVLTDFLNGNGSTINSTSFKSAYEFVMTGLSIIDKEDPNYKSLKVKALFLESQYLMFKSSTRQLALQKVDSAITMQPKAAYLYYSKGIIYKKYLNYDTAITYFNKASSLAPSWPAPYVEKANILRKTGKQIDAINCVELLLSKSDKAITHLSAGDFYYMADSFELAILHYNKALQLDSTLLDGYTGLVSAYLKVFNDSLSDVNWDKAQSISTDEVDFYENYALYHKTKGDYKTAADYYKKLYEKDSTRLNYYVKYAEMLYMSGETSKAERILEHAMSIDPYYTSTYYVLTQLLESIGAYNAAMPYYKYLLSIEPAYNPCNLYYPFMKLNMPDSAFHYMELGRKKFPEDSYTLEIIAYHSIQIGQYQDAIDIYNLLISKKINNTDVYSNLAWCYDMLGDGKNCVENMYKALKLDEYDVDNYRDIVRYMYKYEYPGETILKFVRYPLHKDFGWSNESYMTFAVPYLLYYEDYMEAADVCVDGMSQFPYNYSFPFYHALNYRANSKLGPKDVNYAYFKDKTKFYYYFELAVNLGLPCNLFSQYAGVLPDPNKDKKYQKMSSSICR